MKRISGILLIAVFAAVAALCALSGITLDGRDPLSIQCSRSDERPAQGGPFSEQTRVEGTLTFLPLGVVCTYDVDGDAFGPQSVAHPNWPATIGVLVSLALVVSGVVLVAQSARAKTTTSSF